MHDIRPLLLLGAGALGMLAGLELGSNDGPRPVGAWRAALSITLVPALVVIAAPLAVASALGHDVRGSESWTAALLLAGVVALGTDGAVVRTVAAAIGARGPAPELGVAVASAGHSHRAHASNIQTNDQPANRGEHRGVLTRSQASANATAAKRIGLGARIEPARATSSRAGQRLRSTDTGTDQPVHTGRAPRPSRTSSPSSTSLRR